MTKKSSAFGASALGAAFTGLLTAGAAMAAVYALVLRPRHMRWGAAASEVKRALPGDELVPTPKYRATHAVTIRAAPGDIWPWLVQIGQGRGGFYSYDFIENAMGLNIHSTNQILPEFQNLKVGDTIPLAPDGSGIPVAGLEPNRVLVLGGTMDEHSEGAFKTSPGEFFSASWAFVLEPVAPDVTRLIERFQLDYSPSPFATLFYRAFLEPGSFIMERKMLLGIKARAECRAGEPFAGSRPGDEIPIAH
ncbi:MAG: SRPBCC family protein [Anaerolineae bacterium]|nr:SRPBCC family protein [Anaerolineae bacterium]